jgi:hypothetical protein
VPRPSSRLFLPVLVAVALVGACSDGGHGSAASTSTTLVDATSGQGTPDGAKPQASVVEAVKVLMLAESKLDRRASFALLSPDARVEFKSLADWTRRRLQLPTPVGFEVKGGKDEHTAVATVTYVPSLDPFKGLITTKEIETWTGVKVAGGWLLDAEPDVELVLPDEMKASDAAASWARAVQACDQAAAGKLQGVSILFGTSTQAGKLCGSTGTVQAGAPGPLTLGPAATEIVAQYSSDALSWARAVVISGPVRFVVVTAPIGEDWKVIGIADT